MRIAICDDERVYLDATANIINRHFKEKNYMVNTFEKAVDFYSYFDINTSVFDIVIIDIEMPDVNGIELASYIRSKNTQVRIIFLTNHLEYAPEVYETEHTFYVMKTDAKNRLPIAIKKAVNQLENIKKDIICIDTLHNGKVIIRTDDIIYIERRLRTSVIFTKTDIEETSENIEKIAARIKPGILSRIHRSFFVNMHCIKALKGNEVILCNSQILNVTRNYSKSFKKDFMNYIKTEQG